jgi:hypothetical protein
MECCSSSITGARVRPCRSQHWIVLPRSAGFGSSHTHARDSGSRLDSGAELSPVAPPTLPLSPIISTPISS